MNIDKGIPIPGFGGKSSKYPFSEMQIGDSFAVTVEDRGKVSNAVSQYNVNNPTYRFTLRQFEGAYRCWRVAVEKAS